MSLTIECQARPEGVNPVHSAVTASYPSTSMAIRVLILMFLW